MTYEEIGRLVHAFEPFHAARGGHVVDNLNTWGADRGLSEDVLDRMWAYLGSSVITDSACLDLHVWEYWHGPSKNPPLIMDSI